MLAHALINTAVFFAVAFSRLVPFTSVRYLPLLWVASLAAAFFKAKKRRKTDLLK